MRIAYLVNRYPWPSHTFIRREIESLERLGATVLRFSIRSTDPEREIVDPADREEWKRTRGVLTAGMGRLLAATAGAAVCRPGPFLAALREAITIGWRSDRGLLRHLMYLCEACQLCAWLRTSRVEHLHAHFATNPAAVAMLCRIVGGPPYSFTIHGPEPFEKAAKLSLGRKVERAAFVIAISDYARGQLRRWCHGEQWHKIHVVRCGIDESFLHVPQSDVPDAPRFICIARLVEEKGLFILLDAARTLARDGVDFDLAIVGDGPLRRELEAAITADNLRDRVRLTGWAPAKEVRRFLLSSRALILPSFAEGLPIVLMEAMALGRPVITTSVAGIPELVEPGAHGWLVPPGHAQDLANAMREALAASTERLSGMGRAGAAAVRRSHDGMKQADALAAIFAREIKGPTSAVAAASE